MKAALECLNGLVDEGVLLSYAIGGAVGALFYAEPVSTYDLDVFVLLPPEAAASLAPLSRAYDRLRAQGHDFEREHVVIEGVPVQILPAYNALVEEAVREAADRTFAGTSTRVCRAEHLVALLVQTGRPKDRARLELMLREATLDAAELQAVLQRHDLAARFEAMKREWE